MLGLGMTDAPAVIDAASGSAISYRSLLEEGRELTNHLGSGKALLFLLCRNDVFTTSTYAAALDSGHAVAMLDGSRPIEATAELVAAYRPVWFCGAAGTGNALASLGIAVERVVQLERGELVALGYEAPSVHRELAVLLSTSGTTGSRKFVRLSQRNIESNATAIAQYLELGARDRPISSLPLHYTFGLSVLNSHWTAGAAVVLTAESVIQRTFWDVFRDYACTTLAGVPYTYMMLERVGFRDMDLPSLTTMQQAGGALDRRLAGIYSEHMARQGGRLFVMYGQTEATARMAYVPPDRLAEKLGSAGIPVPGGRIWIEGGERQSPDGPLVGEVVYEGPNVMMGYAVGPEDLARGDELGGALRTGDIGYQDDDGYLYLVGRSKRIAKVFGLRVNLDEVEAMLREHGPVAVVGREDAIWAFCAFGNDESVAAVGDALARRLRVHRTAVHARHVEDIPATEAGKVDYQLVQRWMTS
jgi:acyl-CoA synthetase (AMP-forming)/AMP-acid ligase II